MTCGTLNRVTAVITSIALFAVGLIPVTIYALYWALLACDEVCESQSGWHSNQGAWQWKAQLLIALLAVAASMIGIGRAWQGGWQRLGPWAAFAIASYLGWALFVAG